MNCLVKAGSQWVVRLQISQVLQTFAVLWHQAIYLYEYFCMYLKGSVKMHTRTHIHTYLHLDTYVHTRMNMRVWDNSLKSSANEYLAVYRISYKCCWLCINVRYINTLQKYCIAVVSCSNCISRMYQRPNWCLLYVFIDLFLLLVYKRFYCRFEFMTHWWPIDCFILY